MIYFLDTNICIFFLKNTNRNLCDKLLEIPTGFIKIPSMVAAELLYGAEKSARREHNLGIMKSFLSIYEIIPFDEQAAGHYSQIRSGLERIGSIIGGNDIIIAATALAGNGVLVTNNTREFSRIKSLQTEDWTVG